ncbi:MAG: ATP-binding protein [bacterium]|nr:ATP-binding protein [bacterium]
MEISKESIKLILETIPVAVTIFQRVDNQCEAIYMNRECCVLDCMDIADRIRMLNEDLYYHVHPNDAGKVTEMMQQIQSADYREVEFRYWSDVRSQYIWLQARVRSHPMAEGGCYLIAVFIDVSKQHDMMNSMAIDHARIELALNNSKLVLWEYDVRNRSSIHSETVVREFQVPRIQQDMPESMIRDGIIHKESIADYRALFSDIDKGAQFAEREIHMIDAKKRDRWYRLKLKNQYDETGQPIYAYGWGENITEMRLEELRLYDELRYQQETESRDLLIKGLFNITQNRVLRYEAENGVSISYQAAGLDYAASTKVMAKHAANDRDRQHLLEMMHPDNLKRVLSEGRDYIDFEYQRRGKDGKVIWVRKEIKLRIDPRSGDVIAYLYVYDINQRKFTESVFAEILKLYYDFIGVIDAKGGYWNCLYRPQGSEEPVLSYGNYPEAIKAYVEAEQKYFPKNSTANALAAVQLDKVCEELEKKDVHMVRYMRMDPTTNSLHSYFSLFRYMDEQHSQIFTLRMDITDALNKELSQQENLEVALARAEEASKAKSTFLSNVSHEIRTPMNSIMGSTALALQSLHDPEQLKELLLQTQESEKYLMTLINNLLDVSRIESGKQRLDCLPMDLRLIIQGVNSVIEPQAKERELRYEWRVSDEIEDWYLGDGIKLQQVLVNLLGNAVKFTPSKGVISLEVSVQRVEEDRTWITIDVCDNGIGMSDEFQEHMFEPFEQEHQELTSSFGGSGLGLAICKNLIVFMGGQIQVESTEGVGTRFHIILPLLRYFENQEESASAKKSNDATDLFDGMQVLLVEDHDLNIRVAKRLLEVKGISVTVAHNGQEAIDCFSESENDFYDLILMDIRMPVKDGLTAARELRGLERKDAKLVPIVAMSANAYEQDVIQSKAAGMNEHLAKPIDPELLYTTVAHYYSR